MADLSVEYSIVDVFSNKQFEGNPVAVIHDGRQLSTQQMQQIAREFGFSETTFICPPRTSAYSATVRIFTPSEEIPFAGHPNIGTAFVVALEDTAARLSDPDMALFDEAGGDVAVTVLREASRIVGASIDAPQALQVLGGVPAARVARCLGLPVGQITSAHVAPCVASVGLPFAFAELQTCADLSTVSPDIVAFRAAVQEGPKTVDDFALCAFVVLGERDGVVRIRSRVLSPLDYAPEDPATGSASGALAALLARGSTADLQRFEITQGVEMGRPSHIYVTVDRPAQRISIAGGCVAVSRGTLTFNLG